MSDTQTLDVGVTHEQCRRAYHNTSFDPDKRGDQRMQELAYQMQRGIDALGAAFTGDTLAAQVAAFTHGFQSRARDLITSESRCASAAITGPARFNVARAEKRNDIAHRRAGELYAYVDAAVARAQRELKRDDPNRPINIGDADAEERLVAKVAELTAHAESMVAANKAIRAAAKHGPEAQLKAIMDAGIPEEQARDLLKPDYMGRVGFAGFELSNNRANLRRYEQQLERVRRNKARPVVVAEPAVESSTGIRVEVNAAENRVRVYFPGKPDDATRARLRKGGFRWAPSQGAWSGYCNYRTEELAHKLAKGE